jgi:hypothetical protein
MAKLTALLLAPLLRLQVVAIYNDGVEFLGAKDLVSGTDAAQTSTSMDNFSRADCRTRITSVSRLRSRDSSGIEY